MLWCSEDVDGDCISLNLYRKTKSSKFFLERWRCGEEISEQENTAKLTNSVFF